MSAWIFLAITIGIGMTGLAAVIYFPLRWRARQRGLPEGRYLLTWLGCVAGVPAAALLPWLLQKFNVAGRATSVDLGSHAAASSAPLSSAPLSSAPLSSVPLSSVPLPEPGPLSGWALALMVVGTALFVVLPILGGVLGFYVWRRPGPASLER